MHLWPDLERGPWLLELRWRIVDGRPECIGARLASGDTFDDLSVPFEWLERGYTPQPITGTVIRALGIPERISSDRAAIAAELEPERGDTYVPPGMRRSTADRFRRVAAVYREALAAREKPVRAVAREFGITESSASNLVARTRAAGFLPPASPGVATG